MLAASTVARNIRACRSASSATGCSEVAVAEAWPRCGHPCDQTVMASDNFQDIVSNVNEVPEIVGVLDVRSEAHAARRGAFRSVAHGRHPRKKARSGLPGRAFRR
ncbi:MAG TPA: hypothetical protein VFX89_04770 [Gammaproteobacteria bacterium]|nr:hypothetical protein [Gammaproteobacteria bacterium]